MNQLFRITDNEIHIDSLTLEGLNCAKNCRGCYFQNHKRQGFNTLKYLGCELFDLFFDAREKKYSVNQISISVNEPICSEDYTFIDNLLISNQSIRRYLSPKDIKVHLTMFSPQTISEYNRKIGISFFAEVDSIYFSNILTDEDLDIVDALRAQNKNLEIGWNATSGISTSKRNILEDNRFDGIYQVVNKASKQPIFSFAGEPKKIQQDVCLTDYNNWKQTGKPTCPANISKFTIWPDGSVSGCPYTKTSNTGPAQTVNGILANIVEASKYYDFDRCPLKGLY